MEPDRPQHTRPAASVITQQHYTATFVSQRFHSGKEKYGGPFKYINVAVF
jgi:hypothetical protein